MGSSIARRGLVALFLSLAAVAPAGAEMRDFPAAGFTALRSTGAADVVVKTGPGFAVQADGDPAALALLDIRVERGTLVVGLKRGARWRDRMRATVNVTLPALAAAAVEGSGNVRIGALAGSAFAGEASGSGNLTLDDLRTDMATLSSSGSGNVVAAGKVGRLRIAAEGSGNVDARALSSETAELDSAGSGNVDARASVSARVRASGSGTATARGAARCDRRSSGSGEAVCRE